LQRSLDEQKEKLFTLKAKQKQQKLKPPLPKKFGGYEESRQPTKHSIGMCRIMEWREFGFDWHIAGVCFISMVMFNVFRKEVFSSGIFKFRGITGDLAG
ncbi:hypothetical protein ACH5RR_026026, partial [Cinchona calisaya]